MIAVQQNLSAVGAAGLDVSLDRRLPQALPVGPTTALFWVGTCFHPSPGHGPGGLPEARSRPLVAICMATFNPDMELFRTQIESIRPQTDRDWICLISDDCSEPERFEAIVDTVAGDERFVLCAPIGT